MKELPNVIFKYFTLLNICETYKEHMHEKQKLQHDIMTTAHNLVVNQIGT